MSSISYEKWCKLLEEFHFKPLQVYVSPKFVYSMIQSFEAGDIMWVSIPQPVDKLPLDIISIEPVGKLETLESSRESDTLKILASTLDFFVQGSIFQWLLASRNWIVLAEGAFEIRKGGRSIISFFLGCTLQTFYDHQIGLAQRLFEATQSCYQQLRIQQEQHITQIGNWKQEYGHWISFLAEWTEERQDWIACRNEFHRIMKEAFAEYITLPDTETVSIDDEWSIQTRLLEQRKQREAFQRRVKIQQKLARALTAMSDMKTKMDTKWLQISTCITQNKHLLDEIVKNIQLYSQKQS